MPVSSKSILAQGYEVFSTQINLEVQWASQTAIAAVERAGGRIRTAYYDLESLKAAENPEGWFRAGKPIPRRKYPPHSLLNYYMDPDYRGCVIKQSFSHSLYCTIANSSFSDIWPTQRTLRAPELV
jgi:hypothetical protein